MVIKKTKINFIVSLLIFKKTHLWNVKPFESGIPVT